MLPRSPSGGHGHRRDAQVAGGPARFLLEGAEELALLDGHGERAVVESSLRLGPRPGVAPRRRELRELLVERQRLDVVRGIEATLPSSANSSLPPLVIMNV